MSSIGPVSSAPVQRQTPPFAKNVDADGDHDGTKVAAPAAKPAAPPLATSGTVGRQVNTFA